MASSLPSNTEGLAQDASIAPLHSQDAGLPGDQLPESNTYANLDLQQSPINIDSSLVMRLEFESKSPQTLSKTPSIVASDARLPRNLYSPTTPLLSQTPRATPELSKMDKMELLIRIQSLEKDLEKVAAESDMHEQRAIQAESKLSELSLIQERNESEVPTSTFEKPVAVSRPSSLASVVSSLDKEGVPGQKDNGGSMHSVHSANSFHSPMFRPRSKLSAKELATPLHVVSLHEGGASPLPSYVRTQSALIEQLQSQLEMKNLEIAALQAALGPFTSDSRTGNEELSARNAEMESLQALLAEKDAALELYTAEIQSLKQELRDTQSKLSAALDFCQEAKQANGEFRDLMQSLPPSSNNSQADKITAVSARLEQLDLSLASMELSNADLAPVLADTQAQLVENNGKSKQNAQNPVVDRDMEELAELLRFAEADKMQLSHDLAELQVQYDTLVQERSLASSEVTELTTRLVELESEYVFVQREKESLEAELAELKKNERSGSTDKRRTSISIGPSGPIDVVDDTQGVSAQGVDASDFDLEVVQKLRASYANSQVEIEQLRATNRRLTLSIGKLKTELSKMRDATINGAATHSDVPATPNTPAISTARPLLQAQTPLGASLSGVQLASPLDVQTSAESFSSTLPFSPTGLNMVQALKERTSTEYPLELRLRDVIIALKAELELKDTTIDRLQVRIRQLVEDGALASNKGLRGLMHNQKRNEARRRELRRSSIQSYYTYSCSLPSSDFTVSPVADRNTSDPATTGVVADNTSAVDPGSIPGSHSAGASPTTTPTTPTRTLHLLDLQAEPTGTGAHIANSSTHLDAMADHSPGSPTFPASPALSEGDFGLEEKLLRAISDRDEAASTSMTLQARVVTLSNQLVDVGSRLETALDRNDLLEKQCSEFRNQAEVLEAAKEALEAKLAALEDGRIEMEARDALNRTEYASLLHSTVEELQSKLNNLTSELEDCVADKKQTGWRFGMACSDASTRLSAALHSFTSLIDDCARFVTVLHTDPKSAVSEPFASESQVQVLAIASDPLSAASPFDAEPSSADPPHGTEATTEECSITSNDATSNDPTMDQSSVPTMASKSARKKKKGRDKEREARALATGSSAAGTAPIGIDSGVNTPVSELSSIIALTPAASPPATPSATPSASPDRTTEANANTNSVANSLFSPLTPGMPLVVAAVRKSASNDSGLGAASASASKVPTVSRVLLYEAESSSSSTVAPVGAESNIEDFDKFFHDAAVSFGKAEKTLKEYLSQIHSFFTQNQYEQLALQEDLQATKIALEKEETRVKEKEVEYDILYEKMQELETALIKQDTTRKYEAMESSSAYVKSIEANFSALCAELEHANTQLLQHKLKELGAPSAMEGVNSSAEMVSTGTDGEITAATTILPEPFVSAVPPAEPLPSSAMPSPEAVKLHFVANALRGEVRLLTARLLSVQERALRLEMDLQAARNTMEEQRDLLEELELKESQLDTEFRNEAAGLVETLQGEKDALAKEVESLRSELEKAQTMHIDVVQKLDGVQKSVDMSKSTYRELQNSLVNLHTFSEGLLRQLTITMHSMDDSLDEDAKHNNADSPLASVAIFSGDGSEASATTEAVLDTTALHSIVGLRKVIIRICDYVSTLASQVSKSSVQIEKKEMELSMLRQQLQERQSILEETKASLIVTQEKQEKEKQELAVLRSDHAKVIQENTMLLARTRDLEHALQLKNSEDTERMIELESMNLNLAEQLTECQQAKHAAENALLKYQSDFSAIQEKLNERTIRLEASERLVEELGAERDVQVTRLEELQRSLDSVEVELAHTKELCTITENSLVSLETEYEKLQEQLATEKQEHEALQRSIAETTAQLTQEQQRVENVRQQLEVLQQQHSVLQSEKAELETIYQTCQDQLQQFNGKLTLAAEQEMVRMNAELEEKHQLQVVSQELSHDLETTNLQVKYVEDQVSQLFTEYDKAMTLLAATEDEKIQLEARISDMDKELSACQGALHSASMLNAQLEENLNVLRSNEAILSDRIEELQTELTSNRSQLITQQGDLFDKTQQLESTSFEIQAMESTLEETQSHCFELETRIHELETEKKETEQTLSEIREHLQTLTEERDSLSAELQSCKGQLSEIEASMHARLHSLEETLSALSSDFEKTQEEKRALQQLKDELTREHEQEKAAAAEKLRELAHSNDLLQKEVQIKELELHVTQRDCSEKAMLLQKFTSGRFSDTASNSASPSSPKATATRPAPSPMKFSMDSPTSTSASSSPKPAMPTTESPEPKNTIVPESDNTVPRDESASPSESGVENLSQAHLYDEIERLSMALDKQEEDMVLLHEVVEQLQTEKQNQAELLLNAELEKQTLQQEKTDTIELLKRTRAEMNALLEELALKAREAQEAKDLSSALQEEVVSLRKELNSANHMIESLQQHTQDASKLVNDQEVVEFERRLVEKDAKLRDFQSRLDELAELHQENDKKMRELEKSVSDKDSEYDALQQAYKTLLEKYNALLKQLPDPRAPASPAQLRTPLRSALNDEVAFIQHELATVDQEIQRLREVTKKEGTPMTSPGAFASGVRAAEADMATVPVPSSATALPIPPARGTTSTPSSAVVSGATQNTYNDSGASDNNTNDDTDSESAPPPLFTVLKDLRSPVPSTSSDKPGARKLEALNRALSSDRRLQELLQRSKGNLPIESVKDLREQFLRVLNERNEALEQCHIALNQRDALQQELELLVDVTSRVSNIPLAQSSSPSNQGTLGITGAAGVVTAIPPNRNETLSRHGQLNAYHSPLQQQQHTQTPLYSAPSTHFASPQYKQASRGGKVTVSIASPPITTNHGSPLMLYESKLHLHQAKPAPAAPPSLTSKETSIHAANPMSSSYQTLRDILHDGNATYTVKAKGEKGSPATQIGLLNRGMQRQDTQVLSQLAELASPTPFATKGARRNSTQYAKEKQSTSDTNNPMSPTNYAYLFSSGSSLFSTPLTYQSDISYKHDPTASVVSQPKGTAATQSVKSPSQIVEEINKLFSSDRYKGEDAHPRGNFKLPNATYSNSRR